MLIETEASNLFGIKMFNNQGNLIFNTGFAAQNSIASNLTKIIYRINPKL